MCKGVIKFQNEFGPSHTVEYIHFVSQPIHIIRGFGHSHTVEYTSYILMISSKYEWSKSSKNINKYLLIGLAYIYIFNKNDDLKRMDGYIYVCHEYTRY